MRWVVVAGLLVACRPEGVGVLDPSVDPTTGSERAMPGSDLHSFSRPEQVLVRHLGLEWTVSFEERQLMGVATLWVERRDPSAPLWLDTRGLKIETVETGVRPEDAGSWGGAEPEGMPHLVEIAGVVWEEARWSLGEADAILGRPLAVELPPGDDLVRIVYRTSPDASGLQWLSPAQTADGTDPFLYSQSQAIHARSWIPCQDSPGVRVTYDAVVRVPQTPGAEDRVALMSARGVRGDLPAGEHRFEMPQPIPAYLVALAVGRVELETLGDRSAVWAEPSVLPRAAREFADVERMIAVAESLYGPYRWERYDVLVLPPAFPFGGMENPRLTFATPTILAGDRSLVALIAHELAHSWSGNLVTNATWADLWLNEGFTTYIERRIVEALYGQERAEMEAVLGQQLLEGALAELGDAEEHLYADLEGRDPDDALSDIAYEKGALFLAVLEQSYGRDVFDRFLERWFREHAFTSVTTAQFERFAGQHLDAKSDMSAWIHGPGLPATPKREGDVFADVDAAMKAFVAGRRAKELPTAQWSPHEWLHFLHALPDALPIDRLRELDRAYALTKSGNSEVLALWLEVGVRHGYREVDDRLRRFLVGVGRLKFLEPLYGALLDVHRENDAIEIYREARPGYHPITQRSLDRLLGATQ
jgi:leukotriene-A4 hydrolase